MAQTVEGGFLRISALLFMEAVAGCGWVARWSGHQSGDKTAARPQTTMFTQNMYFIETKNMYFIYITICMYDGYGPNRILTKCLIHNRLFVLYIFSILKLNTCSIGHGWGKIVTIDTLAVCCPEKDRFVGARRSGTRGCRSRAGRAPRSRPAC